MSIMLLKKLFVNNYQLIFRMINQVSTFSMSISDRFKEYTRFMRLLNYFLQFNLKNINSKNQLTRRTYSIE